jgi:hypothetical protein
MQSLDWNGTDFAGRARRGSVLLALLMGIVILMALYFLDVRTIFRPTGKVTKSGQVLPWLEENRLVGPTKFVQLPQPPKPTLEKSRLIQTKVTRDGQERGQLEMEIGADGMISGSWDCEFTQDTREATFAATFEGNVDITKTFQDAQGEQPSYLYLYTMGDYTETIYDRKTTRGGVNGGHVYVTGWLRPDGSALGTLTITTDKKWHAEYEWGDSR